MKALKIIGILLLVVIVLAVAGSFLLPRHIHVERSKVIDAPKEQLFNIVVDLKQMGEWDPWSQIDPDMETVYEGEDGQVGAKRIWTSGDKNVGSGSMTITEVVPNEKVAHALDFGDQGTANSAVKLTEVEGGTEVTWTFEMDAGMNPMARIMGTMMDGFIGPDYEKGLDNLQNYAMANIQPIVELPEYEIYEDLYSIESTPAYKLITVKYLDTDIAELDTKMEEAFGKLNAFAQEKNIEVDGPPGAIYYEWDYDAGKTDFAVALPVAEQVAGEGEVVYTVLPAQEEMMTYDYIGQYDMMMAVYDKLMERIAAEGYVMDGPAIEIYEVGPPAETDSSKFVTTIMFPLAKAE